MSNILPDGRNRLEQENSLLRSQLANCNAEIKRLRNELLRYSAGSDMRQIYRDMDSTHKWPGE